MPASTPLGIVYPCGGETINSAVIKQHADSVQQALADMDALAQQVIHPPAAQVVRSASSQSIAAGVSTAVIWDNENYDTGGLFTLASPTILTVQSPGTYLVSNILSQFSLPTTGTSLRQAILLNGSERGFNKSDAATGSFGYAVPQTVSALLISLSIGDQVSINVLFTGTGNMGIRNQTAITKMSTT